MVTPTAGNDALYGYYDSNDTLNGLGGNDTLYGYAGNDTLLGGSGDDVLDGGYGNDSLNGSTGNDSLIGGKGNDTYIIAKNDGQDTITDLAGADTLNFTDVASTDITQISRIGYNGLLLKYGSTGQVTINNYFGYPGVGSAGVGNIEKLQFSDGVSWFLANIKPKVLQPTAGNDVLYGYDNSNDTLSGSAGNDNLYSYSGNDTLNGGTGNDVLAGGTGNDVYLIAKNDGLDTVNDPGGIDTIKFSDVASTDITGVTRTGYSGYDLLVKYGSSQVTIQYYFDPYHANYTGSTRIEKFMFSNGVAWYAGLVVTKAMQATAGNDTLYGFVGKDDVLNGYSGDDTLYGYSGNNTLNGGGGNDTLYGGDNNDILNGGTGNDVMYGGYGNDSYWVDSTGDTVYEYAYGGTDTVFSSVAFDLSQHLLIENLTLLAGVQNAIGNNSDNILTGNTAANVLSGGNGNDSLYGGDSLDSLNGGAGNDLLNGGNGFDIAQYYTAPAGVTVNLSLTVAQDTGGAGTDTLASIEAVNGSAYGDTLTGNSLDNTLFGRNGDDTLNGAAGSDTLVGGLGNDTLTGGQSFDTFVFDSALGATNLDTITDFSVTADTIQLDNSIFTTLTSTGALAANEFLIIGNGAVADSNDYIQYNSVSGGLFYDADGSGAGAAVQVAVLGTGLAMTSADFMVA